MIYATTVLEQTLYPLLTVTGQALSPIYISTKGRFHIALVCNQSLTTASESRLFGLVVRALVLYRGDPGLIPSEDTGNFSAMLYFVMAIMSYDGGSSGIGHLFA